MKEKQKTKQDYQTPQVEVYGLSADSEMLAQSPLVQPGGGSGGSVTIVPLSPDDDDTEISGAKKMTVWEE